MEISSLHTLITYTFIEKLDFVKFIHYNSFSFVNLYTPLPWASHILLCLRSDLYLNTFETSFEDAIVELEVSIEDLHRVWIDLARKFKKSL